jgi:hypothetical protein
MFRFDRFQGGIKGAFCYDNDRLTFSDFSMLNKNSVSYRLLGYILPPTLETA